MRTLGVIAVGLAAWWLLLRPAAVVPGVASWKSLRWTWAGATVEQRVVGLRGLWWKCDSGPGEPQTVGCLDRFDMDGDGDVDLWDRAEFEAWTNEQN